MSWGATNGDSTSRPLNLELPFVKIGSQGMTARLEFNWIDDLQIALSEACSSEIAEATRLYNPLYLAKRVYQLDTHNLIPVLKHTTFRQKFGLWESTSDTTPPAEVMVINLDLVVAQDLSSHRVGSYWDVDISSLRPIDEAQLKQVMLFAASLSTAYDLKPNPGTKAWRDAQAVGWPDTHCGVF